MDLATVYTLPLAEASHFEEWFEIAIKWKAGKKYRWVPPTKEKKVDGSKGELVGLSTPPASPLKPKSPSSLDSSVTAPPCSIKSFLAPPVSESSSLTPPSLTSPVVVAASECTPTVNSDSSSSWVADLPSHPKSLAPPRAPPSPPPELGSRFENEFFEVKISPKGGLGCFARTEIKRGTTIHSEEPLFISSILQVYHNFEQLTAEQQAAYMQLHCWQGLANHKVVAIFQTNRSQQNGLYTIDEIKKGQELTISYASIPNHLYDNYGFFCDCPGCPSWDFQHKQWKAEDDLRKRAELNSGKEVWLEEELYPVNTAWENDVYEW